MEVGKPLEISMRRILPIGPLRKMANT